MKKSKLFTFLMAGLTFAFAACNDSADKTEASADSLNTNTNTAVNAETSAGDYSAYADEIEKNSSQGYYVNPKTGKAYQKLSVNRSTGEITDENNEPVYRYVDNRDWWVYGLDNTDWSWGKMGEAKLDKEQLMYKDENGKWVTYDTYWKSKDDEVSKSWKTKSGDTKIKFDKDGDIKVKDENGKVKYDADDNKIKTDDND